MYPGDNTSFSLTAGVGQRPLNVLKVQYFLLHAEASFKTKMERIQEEEAISGSQGHKRVWEMQGMKMTKTHFV